MNEEIKSKLEEELGSISEMFDSAGVRGEKFKHVAIASFESNQVMEMVANIASVTDEENSEFVDSMVESVANLLQSILLKMSGGMTREETAEAFNFGSKVHDRKIAIQDQISKLM